MGLAGWRVAGNCELAILTASRFGTESGCFLPLKVQPISLPATLATTVHTPPLVTFRVALLLAASVMASRTLAAGISARFSAGNTAGGKPAS